MFAASWVLLIEMIYFLVTKQNIKHIACILRLLDGRDEGIVKYLDVSKMGLLFCLHVKEVACRMRAHFRSFSKVLHYC